MTFNENRLISLTRKFWNNTASDRLQKDYISNLLPQEMAYAREQGNIETTTCDILVLQVGHSIEPLLQTICAFSPQEQIILIVNKTYDDKDGKIPGRRFGSNVQEVISALPEELLNRSPFREENFAVVETEAQPAAVFRVLQQKLRDSIQKRKRIIIDITGAKKSMVVGAFLYAAYTGVPISYVDFDYYDPEKGRPFGFTCRIKLLKDPYDAFQLRDWERLQHLYQSYQFRAARQILCGWHDLDGIYHPGLLQWMSQEEEGQRYFNEEQCNAVSRLAKVLEVYELWDNGDFYYGWKKLQDFSFLLEKFVPPLALQKLGNFWPYTEPDLNSKQAANRLLEGLHLIESGREALPTIPHYFVIYARDEIAKINRLIDFNEDYRSALLRSVGLGESLLKARWVSLWVKGHVEIASQPDGTYELIANAPQEIRDRREQLTAEILGAYQARQLLPGLRYSDKDKQKYLSYFSIFGCKRDKDGSLKNCLYLRRFSADSVPRLDKEFTFGQYQKLRDKAIHTYLSVPREVAQEALSIARASLEDYEAEWAVLLDAEVAKKVGRSLDYEAMSWNELCDLCGIDFLPPAYAGKEVT